MTPVGIQMGTGVKVGATQRIITQGSLQSTGVDTDLAVVGEGYFRVQQYDGSFAYTRDGSFKVDMNGQLVTSEGLRVMPEIILRKLLPNMYLPLYFIITTQLQSMMNL